MLRRPVGGGWLVLGFLGVCMRLFPSVACRFCQPREGKTPKRMKSIGKQQGIKEGPQKGTPPSSPFPQKVKSQKVKPPKRTKSIGKPKGIKEGPKKGNPPPLQGKSPKGKRAKRRTGSRTELTLVIPPSTTKSVPLTKLLSSLAKNTTACATSMASPKRPVGKCISRRCRLAASSPSQSCRRGVLVRCQ